MFLVYCLILWSTLQATSIPVATDQVFVKLNIQIDVEAEKEKINNGISYLEGYLESVEVSLAMKNLWLMPNLSW
jgi:hypothetical protein